ncbi:MAG: corrinoid protein [Clostridiaceae bacterium]|nr:corrinoid protein [Clostridiaceae bacterium]MDD6273312.1 corrinoid protein [Clostridiaceae bacterium]
MVRMEEISEFLQKGRARNVKQLVEEALSEGTAPGVILEEGLLAGMGVIGEKFKNNEVFVPEVLIAARALNAGLDILRPKLAESGVEAKGTAVIGTVKGDLHDIGKNIVKIMFEGHGIQVVDLGVDVSAEQFVDAAVENHANLICCSALLTTTMGEMGRVVEILKERGLRDSVKVMVGGAPITQSFCDSIGADAYAPDAATGAEAAIRLLGEMEG